MVTFLVKSQVWWLFFEFFRWLLCHLFCSGTKQNLHILHADGQVIYINVLGSICMKFLFIIPSILYALLIFWSMSTQTWTSFSAPHNKYHPFKINFYQQVFLSVCIILSLPPHSSLRGLSRSTARRVWCGRIAASYFKLLILHASYFN